MKCASTIHEGAADWPEATVEGVFKSPYSHALKPETTNYCAPCARSIQGIGMFTPNKDADA